MDERTINRRVVLGGIAVGAAGLVGGVAHAVEPSVPVPDFGPSQAPTITDPKNKVAYITGASSGIGLGIARVFHEAGMKVVIGYRNEAHLAEALKFFPKDDARIHAISHDVMERDSWTKVADEIEKKFGALNILVNNAGVGLQASASAGTLNDWDWGMGVNFMGPVYGVHTFVPRMLANKQGAHIVTTTSTSGILPGSGAGIYTVSKIAAVGLMEELRQELRTTNIGTTCFVPGLTTSDIGNSERNRPQSLKNSSSPAAPAAQPRAPSGGAPRPAVTPNPNATPYTARPQDPVTVGRLVLDGILHNDLYVVAQPEYYVGVEARATALLESMRPFQPLPKEMYNDRNYRTPIYMQEIAHRKATQKREIPGIWMS